MIFCFVSAVLGSGSLLGKCPIPTPVGIGFQAPGLYYNNMAGLLPVHDIRVDSVDTGARTVTGHFYLGGQKKPGGEWTHEPMVLVANDPMPGISSFSPRANWEDTDADCSIGDYGLPLEGAKVNFQASLPADINLTGFWIAVQMRGISPDPPGLDEISFAANEYPADSVPDSSQHEESDTIVPITTMFPIRYDVNEADNINVNRPNAGGTFTIFTLDKHHASPRLGLAWKPETLGSTTSPSADNPRRYGLSYTHSGTNHSAHQMYFTNGFSYEAGSNSVVAEVSGVIRPPD